MTKEFPDGYIAAEAFYTRKVLGLFYTSSDKDIHALREKVFEKRDEFGVLWNSQKLADRLKVAACKYIGQFLSRRYFKRTA